jgi:Kef-type K+ transport system membrane component KefB
VVSKWLGAYLGSLKLGHRSAMAIGIGMVPRGEVGVVVASLGLAAGVFTSEVYAVIVAMSLLTSILTPPLLGWALRRAPRDAEDKLPAS